MRRAATGFVFLLLLSVGRPVGAQTSETGIVAGTVSDADGAPIGLAVVSAARADGSNLRNAVTEADGRFRLAFLPPGDYRLNVQAEGYAGGELAELRVSAGGVTEVDVRLQSAAVSETLTVSAAAPRVDTTTNDLGVTLTADEIELLPTSRDADDLVAFTPGARPGQVWGGSTAQANAYQLDGVGVNHPGVGGDFLLPNVDWIEEIEVKGLGAGAEYGNFQGGLINLVTKSGGNQIRGNVRFNFEDESLNSSTLDTREVGAERDSRAELSADVSGPIIEDRLYYFVSAQQSRTDTNIVDGSASESSVVFLPVQEERTETKLYTKLSWEPTDSDRANFTLGWDDVETDNRGLDGFTAPAAAQIQDSPALLYSASWQRVLNGSNFLELKLTGFDAENDRTPLNGDTPAVQILGGDRELFGNAIYTRLQDLTSNALSLNWDSYLELGGADHQLKLGGTYEDGTWLEQRFRNGGYSWRPERGGGPFDPADPSTWGFISSDWGGTIRLDAETTNAAVYVQDYVTLSSRFSASLGLRYSQWEGTLDPGLSAGPSLTAIDTDDLDPRIGFIADLTGDAQYVLKGHWGRFHQSLFALMFDRTEGGDVFEDLEFWDWDGAGLPDLGRRYTEADREDLFFFFEAQPIGEEVGPVVDLDQPYLDQLVLSFEWSPGPRSTFGATWVSRENGDIVALVDRNLDGNYTLFRNVEVIDFRTGDPVLDAAGNPLVLPELYLSNADILSRGGAPGLTAADLAALSFDQDLVLTNAGDAEREMEQIQLTWDQRGDGWRLNASLVYTDLTGNFFSVSGYDNPSGTGAGAFVRPNEQINFSGDLRNYSEWEAKVRASGSLPLGFRGGTFVSYRRGDRYTPVYSIDNRNHDFFAENGDLIHFSLVGGVSGEDIFLEPRGSRRLEDSTVIDAYLERPIQLGPTELVLSADVFNLLNEDAVRDVRESVNGQDPSDPTSLFGATRRRERPRTVRLGVTLRW